MIETQNLKKRYRMGKLDVSALNGVNLRVEAGEFMSIMGASGSGKTTLLNLIGALDRPTEGKVFIKENDIAGLDDNELAELRNREIGFVFQFFNLMARMSALKNVEMPMAFAGVPQEKRKGRATELLEEVGLSERLDHRPTELSGGEQQRVAIARALVNDPSVVLCDEPTGNVDTETGKEIIEILRKMNREQRQTFVIVTHDP
ncbi:MAG: ABC transporter ATP-binding protein, partial [Candidatus Bathyarchaeota archaeon]|nr:ABC transporter ATP-binding protein [Candidatus Bathyarchaeota archaeon]